MYTKNTSRRKSDEEKYKEVLDRLDRKVEMFVDNLADEHFRNLSRLRLQEEMLLLNDLTSKRKCK